MAGAVSVKRMLCFYTTTAAPHRKQPRREFPGMTVSGQQNEARNFKGERNSHREMLVAITAVVAGGKINLVNGETDNEHKLHIYCCFSVDATLDAQQRCKTPSPGHLLRCLPVAHLTLKFKTVRHHCSSCQICQVWSCSLRPVPRRKSQAVLPVTLQTRTGLTFVFVR